MTRRPFRLQFPIAVLAFSVLIEPWAQIDPEKRHLFQAAYNQPLQGSGPFAGYMFYYLNEPGFLRKTNLTLRLAVAPVFADSELGIRQALGPNTDLGIGLQGGGFAYGYADIDQGRYLRGQSFNGGGVTVSTSVYHRFNPDARIPLTGQIRLVGRYTFYGDTDETDPGFVLPEDGGSFGIRAGLRFGGREPVLFPDVAMELSLWYEGMARINSGSYGFNSTLDLEPFTQRFFGRAMLTYAVKPLSHHFSVSLTAGTTINPDRFSAYRMGGYLPLLNEFPLNLPGYYIEELSARSMVLLNGSYSVPLDRNKRWALGLLMGTSYVDYLPGLEQPGDWNSGLGGAISFRSTNEAWHIALAYAHGFNAIRDGHRGADTIGILVQYDFFKGQPVFDPGVAPGRWRGYDLLFR